MHNQLTSTLSPPLSHSPINRLFPNRRLDLVGNAVRNGPRLIPQPLRLALHLALETRLPAAKVPVVEVPVPLHKLRGKVDSVAAEEEVVCGCNGESVAHKCARVEGQRTSHAARDAVTSTVLGSSVWHVGDIVRRYGDVHLGVFAHVRNGRNRDTEVTRWAPEIYIVGLASIPAILPLNPAQFRAKFSPSPSKNPVIRLSKLAHNSGTGDTTYGSSRSNPCTCLSESSH